MREYFTDVITQLNYILFPIDLTILLQINQFNANKNECRIFFNLIMSLWSKLLAKSNKPYYQVLLRHLKNYSICYLHRNHFDFIINNQKWLEYFENNFKSELSNVFFNQNRYTIPNLTVHCESSSNLERMFEYHFN